MAGKIVKKIKTKAVNADIFDVCVIGGGPAGLMAAGIAGAGGARVILLEKNEILGKKLLISGGGRCNITNVNPNHRDFVAKYGKKGNFLFTPFSIFGVPETVKFFTDLGLKIKVEESFRAFPESDKSADVLNALVNFAKKHGVTFKIGAEVVSFTPSLDKEGARGQLKPARMPSEAGGKTISSVLLKDKTEITAKSFILATGGKSHPETGSTGDGFAWLADLGHTVVASNPALVPIAVKEKWVSELAGVSVDSAGISIWLKKEASEEKVFSTKGRMLFTHVGVTGPTILNMSKSIGEFLDYSEVKLALDFFPGVGLDQMHALILDTFEKNLNKKIKNITFPEVPTKVFEIILKQLDIDPEWEINEIRREERLALISKFKKFELTVDKLLGVDKAVVTSGGVALTEVDFKTMRSKIISNLYLVGDILDFDRPSGGFSLQLCWTTGYIAGKNAR